MFRESDDFAFTRLLEHDWRDVLREYQAVAQDLHAWPERTYYSGSWDTFGLYAFGHKRPANCARCPKTTALVEQIPGMVMAGFSRLAPGAHIKPHRGYDGWSQYVLRCHLGLAVNDKCALRVGEETRSWKSGKTLVFCDATEHEAWNFGDEERVVLLVDFRNPAFRWKLLDPDLTVDIEAFIRDQWSDLGMKEKAHYWAWRAMNWRRRQKRSGAAARDARTSSGH
ncbi:MAG TPA: aspartyl/asparaginyl beta-hydroxylase domain-containing protein [Casimicrobiaceae bacterium]